MKKITAILLGILGILVFARCDDGTEVPAPFNHDYPLMCKDGLGITVTDSEGRNLLYSAYNGDKTPENGICLDSLYAEHDNGKKYISWAPYHDLYTTPIPPPGAVYCYDTFFSIGWVYNKEKAPTIALEFLPFPSRQYSFDLVFPKQNKRIHFNVDYKTHFAEYSADYYRELSITGDGISWSKEGDSRGPAGIHIVLK